MLRWSLNVGRIFGIQISIHFTFALLVAYVAYSGWAMDDRGFAGMFWSVAMLLAFFCCVLLHELGHAFTARHFGVQVPRIRILPIGGMAEFDSIPRKPSREILITIAGPAVNFALAALLAVFIEFPEFRPAASPVGSLLDFLEQLLLATAAEMFSAQGLLRQVFLANLLMGTFNLIPVFPMDGGRILRALLAMRFSYLGATFWAATVGKVLAIAGICLALYGGLVMVAVLFSFIFFVGEMEYRAVRYRERADASMREALARLYNMPPAGEPPVLN